MRPKTAVGSVTGSRPNTLTLPVSARHSPSRCLMSVDLPAPFSPTRPNTHPLDTARVTSFSAFFDPKLRDRFVTATTGSAPAESPPWSSRTVLPHVSCRSAQGEFVLHQ